MFSLYLVMKAVSESTMDTSTTIVTDVMTDQSSNS